jgi:hypothetical protein
MKVCFIIPTCEKYFETRVKYQEDAFLKYVNKEDIYYLTYASDLEKRHFGWEYIEDTHLNTTWKYVNFFYHMNITELYDWYVFIDDDTFVFLDRLYSLLQRYDYNLYYNIGKQLDHVVDQCGLYMSGGAGSVLSRPLYSKIVNFIRNNGNIENSFWHYADDICIGRWVQEIQKTYAVILIDHKDFHNIKHTNEEELETAITFHNVYTKDEFDFYAGLFESTKQNSNFIFETKFESNKDVFVLVTDVNYFQKTKTTIKDLRSVGRWTGNIVVITIDFDLDNSFKVANNIIEKKFPLIDKSILLEKIGKKGFTNSDNREINKLNQWEKLHVFDEYFLKWDRVVFLDSGLRVLENVKYLLELNCTNSILAQNDASPNYNADQIFKNQLSYDNQELVELVKNDFGEKIFESHHMLNCMWVYDTNILKICNKDQLIEAMNKYTLCKTNEMGIMNLLFHFKYNLWKPFPLKASNGKYLFEWCELNHSFYTTWRDYCFIKYPITIQLNETPY